MAKKLPLSALALFYPTGIKLVIVAEEKTAEQILAVLEAAVENGEISEPFDVKKDEVVL